MQSCKCRDHILKVQCILFLFLFSMYMFSNIRNTYFDKQGLHQTFLAERRKEISFLKIPKCGSSTVACIILRFGLNNNLSMYLPKTPIISSRDQNVLMQQRKQYDIFVRHTHYNYSFFTTIVHNPTILTIIRRPDSRVISHSFFFHYEKRFSDLKGLNRQSVINAVLKDTYKYSVHNVIASYFGIANWNISDISINKYLLKLNSEFTLVLILERLNESLILLKRLLNWSVFDIIYAVKKKKNNIDIHVNKSQITRLKFTNKLEYRIYNFFNNELDVKIQNAGRSFKNEVAHFQNILKKTSDFCHKLRKATSVYNFVASRWDDSFSITTKDCDLIYREDVNGYVKRNRRVS